MRVINCYAFSDFLLMLTMCTALFQPLTVAFQ